MRIKVDKANDALYIRFDESPVIDSEEVQPGIILDYNEKGQNLIPILLASSRKANYHVNLRLSLCLNVFPGFPRCLRALSYSIFLNLCC